MSSLQDNDSDPPGFEGSRKRIEPKGAEEELHLLVEEGPAHLAAIVESSDDAIISKTLEGIITSWNDGAQRIYGYSAEEAVGQPISMLVPPERPDEVPQILERIRQGEKVEHFETIRVTKDGRRLDISLAVSPIKDSEGNVVGGSTIARDISERKVAERRLREAETRYRTLVEQIPAITYIQEPLESNNSKAVTYMSPQYETILGYPAESEVIDEEHWLRTLHPEDRERVLAEEIRTDKTGEPFKVEYRVIAKDGRVVWLRDQAWLVRDQDEGHPLYWLGVQYDITERKALEERLEHRALHDPLTDLPNRQLLMDRLGQALRRTRRQHNRVAVLFIDLDQFKVVNDSLGHEVGDLLLTVVAQRLGRCLRPEDTLARFGGDELVVLIEAVDDPEEAVQVAERITDELRRPFILEGRELYVAASIGISYGDARTHEPEVLLREADTAMYRVKSQGGGFTVFDHTMYERAFRRLEVENDLRRAMEREEFVVHYQPIFDSKSGELWGIEALVRWDHPERGLLDPDDFVSVAEESGLIIPMGEEVLREACFRAKEWQEENPRTPPLVMCVNLSARQLSRLDFADTVERLLGETGLEGSRLTLDVTETVYIKVLEGNSRVFDGLRSLGVGISIDDFGTGYSSLSYLKRLPADAIKLDKSFVKGLGENIEDTAVVRMIIELAHTLGLEVIAEGVETEEQVALLEEMGCDFAQGYHFAQPLPPEEIPAFLSSDTPT